MTDLKPSGLLNLEHRTVAVLLQAIESGAVRINAAVVGFVVTAAYLVVATVSTDHVFLLRLDEMKMPILNVGVPVHYFALLAPVVVLILHFNILLLQLALSRKVRELRRFAQSEEKAGDTFPVDRVGKLLFASTTVNRLIAQEKTRWERFLACTVHACVYAYGPIVVLIWMVAFFVILHQPFVTTAQTAMVVVDLILILVLLPPALSPNGRYRTSWMELKANSGAGRHGLPRAFLGAAFWEISLVVLAVVACAIWVRIPSDCEREQIDDFLRALKISRNFQLRDRFLTAAAEDQVSKALWPNGPGEDGEEVGGGFERLLPRLTWGVDLRGRDLRCADLSGSILVNADLSGADLTGAKLQGATLVGATFLRFPERVTRLELRETSEDPRVLANLLRKSPEETSEPSVLEQADLTRADLRGALFFGANLEGASLQNARVDGARFVSSRLGNSQLEGLQGAGVYFTGSNLDNAVLDLARLECSDFSWVSARLASFHLADLDGSRFSGADLLGSDFKGAELRGAYDFSPYRVVLQDAAISALCGPNSKDIVLADLRRVRLPGTESDPLDWPMALFREWTEKVEGSCGSPFLAPRKEEMLAMLEQEGGQELCLEPGVQARNEAAGGARSLFTTRSPGVAQFGWLQPSLEDEEYYDKLVQTVLEEASKDQGELLRIGVLQRLNDVTTRRNLDFDAALQRAKTSFSSLCRSESEPYTPAALCRHHANARACGARLLKTGFCG